jgi:hypothetical protein
MVWDEAALERLRALAEAGHSYTTAGRELGITRNAVCGAAHRHRIKFPYDFKTFQKQVAEGLKRYWSGLEDDMRKDETNRRFGRLLDDGPEEQNNQPVEFKKAVNG